MARKLTAGLLLVLLHALQGHKAISGRGALVLLWQQCDQQKHQDAKKSTRTAPLRTL